MFPPPFLSSDVCVSVWISRWLQLKRPPSPGSPPPTILGGVESVAVSDVSSLAEVSTRHVFLFGNSLGVGCYFYAVGHRLLRDYHGNKYVHAH